MYPLHKAIYDANQRGDAIVDIPTDTLSSLPSELQQHRILVTEQAAQFCGYSVSQWRTLVREGRAPKPIALSARRNGWKAGTLIQWLNSKTEAGTATAA
jgi:predicted DNA-binding transcriptional regulator AlpA